MSEYQYYEFRAVDRPLNEEELDEVRALSTRAKIATTHFQNVYNWGDFKGDPEELVERFYDAHLYDSNFGFRRFLIRLPKEAMEGIDLAPYLSEESLRGWTTGTSVLLDFRVEEAEFLELESEDWMPDLLPIRQALLKGDLRPLYLGSLCGVQREELDEDELEPPLPPGLGELNATLNNLGEFLELDSTLIEVAALGSPPFEEDDLIEEWEAKEWIAGLHEERKNDLLYRVISGEERSVRNAMLAGFKKARGGTAGPNAPEPRRVGDLLEAAEKLSESYRQAAEAERLQRESEQREREAKRKAAHLETLRQNGERSWSEAEAWVQTKRPADYDRAVERLLDLREIHSLDGDLSGFELRCLELLARHKGKPSFVDLLRKAGLI